MWWMLADGWRYWKYWLGIKIRCDGMKVFYLKWKFNNIVLNITMIFFLLLKLKRLLWLKYIEFDDTILLLRLFFFLNWMFLRWVARLSKNLQFCSCVILYSGKQNVYTRNDIYHMWDPCQPLIHYSKTMKKVRINTSLIWPCLRNVANFLFYYLKPS